ncbi:hypothetical protein XO09_04250 [Thermosipho sp. 1223]|nr:hypothetical protein XO09_04250 [Thermosipho sp. 1223]
MPLISIITVVLNDPHGLEKTIKSVINQDYPNIEYIIIDGGSSDETIKILKKYENKIDLWISEKDNGIYDAMNKGIKLANGEWINFMNAGDVFYDFGVLSKIFKEKDFSKWDIVYGNAILVGGEKTRPRISTSNITEIKRKMLFNHQASFVKGFIYKEILFDTSFKYAADYDFFLKCYLSNFKFLHINRFIAVYDLNGISSKKTLSVKIEYLKSTIKNKCSVKTISYHIVMVIKVLLKTLLKKILRLIFSEKLYGYVIHKIRMKH